MAWRCATASVLTLSCSALDRGLQLGHSTRCSVVRRLASERLRASGLHVDLHHMGAEAATVTPGAAGGGLGGIVAGSTGTLAGGASSSSVFGSWVVGGAGVVSGGTVVGSVGTVVEGSVGGVESTVVSGVESGVLGGVCAAAGTAVPTTKKSVAITSARNRPIALILSVVTVSR